MTFTSFLSCGLANVFVILDDPEIPIYNSVALLVEASRFMGSVSCSVNCTVILTNTPFFNLMHICA